MGAKDIKRQRPNVEAIRKMEQNNSRYYWKSNTVDAVNVRGIALIVTLHICYSLVILIFIEICEYT